VTSLVVSRRKVQRLDKGVVLKADPKALVTKRPWATCYAGCWDVRIQTCSSGAQLDGGGLAPSLGLGPVHVTAEVESVHIIGANLSEGLYTAIIGAGGVEVSVGRGYGALYVGQEVIDPSGPAGERREWLVLGEAGLRIWGGIAGPLGGVYINPAHLSTAETGMYYGVSAGPFALGIGSNFDTTMDRLLFGAFASALALATTGALPSCE
jgi:hypothetical protein